jgi:hypothetical protein
MSMNGFPTRNGGGLWAITAYFNPAGYARRRANFRRFREHLSLPLVAVELGYGDDFELGEGDAEILIQRRGRDVLWQKERLLNLALDALPPDCRNVAWLDCDIVFEAGDWAERTNDLLDRFALVQPYSHLHHMLPDWTPGCPWSSTAGLEHPPAFYVSSGMALDACLANPVGRIAYSPGIAWAGRRELIERHRFYDACILGGGDSVMARAAYGYFDWAARYHAMGSRKREHYLAWARPFHESVRGNVTFVGGNLFHLWHGSMDARRYHERQKGLAPFEFDPYRDIVVDENGAWRWSSDKREMHDYVRGYFASRKEDG